MSTVKFNRNNPNNMDINTYLKYNNIALIDLTNDFCRSCNAFFMDTGYLTKNQLIALRERSYSCQDIERLTQGIVEMDQQVLPDVIEAELGRIEDDVVLETNVDFENIF